MRAHEHRSRESAATDAGSVQSADTTNVAAVSDSEVLAMNLSEVRTVQPLARSPWLTVGEAAQRARCGAKTIYREVRAGRLRAARVGGRRELRFLSAWVDEWLVRSTTLSPA
jgi:excisionase family DNA binding protein